MRVLELRGPAFGAVAAMFLADLGAEVIKVEPPGGGPLRAIGLHRAWDRGKRSVLADLATSSGIELVEILAQDADVVLIPDDPIHPRLASAALNGANPGLIHVTLSASGSVPGFGSGPGRASLVAARLGLMGQQPGVRPGPIYLGHPGIEYATAYMTIISTLAALRARGLTGRGQAVEASMVDGVLALLTMSWASERGGSSVHAGGRIDLGRRRLLLDSFECADGKLIMVHTGSAGGFARALVLLGLDDEISVDGGPVEMASELTPAEHATMRRRLPAIFKSRDRDEWLRLFWTHQLAALPLQDLGDVFDDDQVRHNRLVQTIDDADLGPIDVVASPLRIDHQPLLLRGAAPRLDADGEQIRASGWSGPRAPMPAITQPLRHALDGVRVVDLGAYFAGPFASRLLADLGADVIKVEQVVGDPMRPLLDMFEAASRGKRALAIDLKAAPARMAVDRLLAGADIVSHNLRPGAAERIGIDHEAARALNPDVVYVHAPGYGSTGPKAALQSFAPLHSGMVGIWAEAAGQGNPPMRAFGNEDHYNGLLGACSMLVGLIHRDRTQRGVHIETPQLNSSVFATCHVVRRGGEVITTLPRLDHGQYGRGPFDRIYRCASGWLAIACESEDEADRALGVLDLDPRPDHAAADLTSRIEARLATRPADAWRTELGARHVPVETVREETWEPLVFDNPELEHLGVVAKIDHPEWGPVTSLANLFHLSDTPGRVTGRAPRIGEHSTELLLELGVPAATIARWLEEGIVRQVDPLTPATANAPRTVGTPT